MQQAEGVDSRYRIKTQQVDVPDGAQLRASGQLRMLVAVLALGAILLFVAVSVADALTNLRTERTRRARGDRRPTVCPRWTETTGWPALPSTGRHLPTAAVWRTCPSGRSDAGPAYESLAVVTPSYAPDLELCRDLNRSVLEWTPADVHHHIIVPRRDERAVRLPARTAHRASGRSTSCSRAGCWPCRAPTRG